MRQDLTIAGMWTAVLLQGFERLGVDPKLLCRDTGLDDACLSDPDARVPRDAAGLLWRAATSRAADRDLGLHVAEVAPLTLSTLLGHLSASAPSIWEMLTRQLHLQRLVAHGSVVSLTVDGPDATVVFARIGGELVVTRHEIEYLAVYFLRYARHFLCPDLLPRRVSFTHPYPGDSSEHERIFGCPVHFAEPIDGLTFSAAALRQRLRHFSEGTFHRLRTEAEAALTHVPVPSCSGEVRMVLRSRLGSGRTDLDSVARTVHVSARTLQRRLSHEGTTFQQVLDAVRRDVAFEGVRDGDELRKVAVAAGFADGPSLWRAFKRWTGLTPQAFRERAAAAVNQPGRAIAKIDRTRSRSRRNAATAPAPRHPNARRVGRWTRRSSE